MAVTIRTGSLALLAAAGLAGSAAAQSSQELRIPPSLRTPQPEAPARSAPQPSRPQAPRTETPRAPAAQPPAQATRPAAPALPGAPWAAPVLPPNVTPPPAQPPAQAASRELELKPDAKNLIDCAAAPKGAVLQVPEPLARWATIYCTKQGHILTSNERYYSAIPRTGGRLRGVVSAAQISGRRGEVGHGAYFTKIDYAPILPADAQKLMAGITPSVLQLVRDKPLFRLSLTADTGQTYQGVVVDPSKDPFWVIPVVDGKLANAGFYVATVDYVNKTRMQ